jgi:peptide chain release factor 1
VEGRFCIYRTTSLPLGRGGLFAKPADSRASLTGTVAPVKFDTYIGSSETRLAEIEQAITTFDFSSGKQDEYQNLNREYQQLKKLLDAWRECQKAQADIADNRELLEVEEDAEFREVIETDITELEAKAAKLDRDIKTLILPPHPNEGRNVIVEIRPAAGGDEAGLFAGDLHRMYTRYAEGAGWKVEMLDATENAVGGFKAVSFSLQGGSAWSMMNLESGVHRVQRVPTTESGGRIHTSTVTVAVLAEAEEVDLKINTEDLRFDVYRASGPGGQCVNTTDSAVRVTHIPTGLIVTSQQEKSQHRNREIAMRILRSRLLEQLQAEEDAKNAAERRGQIGTGDRSERIRTYNYPQSRVTDHRFGVTLHSLSNIMEGDLGELFGEIRSKDAERRLVEELGSE